MNFSLTKNYCDFWHKLVEVDGPFCNRILSQHIAQPTSHEWVGLYRSLEDIMPEQVASVGYFKEFNLGPMQFTAKFMGTFSMSIVSLQYFTLKEVKSNARSAAPPMSQPSLAPLN